MKNLSTFEMQTAMPCEYKKIIEFYEIIQNPVGLWVFIVGALVYDKLKKKRNDENNTIPKQEITDNENEKPKNVTTIQLLPEKIIQEKHVLARKSKIAGNCIIINTQKSIHGIRKGTEKDVKNLENCWKSRLYRVKTFTNLKGKKIIEVIKKYSMKVNEKHEGFIVCILTHGNENGICGSDDHIININEIKNAMYHSKVVKNRSFLKFLVLQACRGSKELTQVENSNDNIDSRIPDENSTLKNSNMKDLAVLYSTCEGYVALRDEDDGTPLITSLCKNVAKYGDSMHLEDLLTQVKDEVGRWTEGGWKMTQAPETSSTCTKNFFLPKAVKEVRIVDGFSPTSESQEIMKVTKFKMKVPENLTNKYIETFQKMNEFVTEVGDIDHLNMMVEYFQQMRSRG